ncbi:MAG: BamA/TamA family outer membrane protein, partial [Chitinispirillia bacterium]
LSSEISFPILERQLYFGIFADAGNTWNNVRNIGFNDLYPGVGFGLRLDLPMVGLLGFDFAWPLKDPANPHFDKKLSNKPSVHFLMQQGF